MNFSSKFLLFLANLYALSDKVVCYSVSIKGVTMPHMSEELMEDHGLLDDFYHELQDELNNNWQDPIPGADLFDMAEIVKAEFGKTTKDTITEVADWFFKIIGDARDLCKNDIDDQWLLHIFGNFIQKAKIRYALYRDFTS